VFNKCPGAAAAFRGSGRHLPRRRGALGKRSWVRCGKGSGRGLGRGLWGVGWWGWGWRFWVELGRACRGVVGSRGRVIGCVGDGVVGDGGVRGRFCVMGTLGWGVRLLGHLVSRTKHMAHRGRSGGKTLALAQDQAPRLWTSGPKARLSDRRPRRRRGLSGHLDAFFLT
jgi:hypothetical protein